MQSGDDDEGGGGDGGGGDGGGGNGGGDGGDGGLDDGSGSAVGGTEQDPDAPGQDDPIGAGAAAGLVDTEPAAQSEELDAGLVNELLSGALGYTMSLLGTSVANAFGDGALANLPGIDAYSGSARPGRGVDPYSGTGADEWSSTGFAGASVYDSAGFEDVQSQDKPSSGAPPQTYWFRDVPPSSNSPRSSPGVTFTDGVLSIPFGDSPAQAGSGSQPPDAAFVPDYLSSVTPASGPSDAPQTNDPSGAGSPAPQPPNLDPRPEMVRDWTTQTEWAYPVYDKRLIPPITQFDSGNRPVNFVMNKILLPWVNAASALVNISTNIQQGMHDAIEPVERALQPLMDLYPVDAPFAVPEEAEAEISAFLRHLYADTRGAIRIPPIGRPAQARMEEALWPREILDQYAPIGDGSYQLQPRQLQLFDLRRELWGGPNPETPQGANAFNQAMEYYYEFTPRPGGTYDIGGSSYTYDNVRRLVRVTTDKFLSGGRSQYVLRDFRRANPDMDYGHLGSVKGFGANDFLLQSFGGHPQSPDMNRYGAWRQAERAAFGAIENMLKASVETPSPATEANFRLTAEVRNFTGNVPSEWRMLLEIAGRIMDSGWLRADIP